MSKKLIEIASEIVQTQVSSTSMTAGDIASSLRQVFSTLHELQRAESGEIELPKTQRIATAPGTHTTGFYPKRQSDMLRKDSLSRGDAFFDVEERGKVPMRHE